MSQHANRVQMTLVTGPGIGPITLSAPLPGYQSFAAAYGANATVDILIVEGEAWEVCRDCEYDNATSVVTRGTLEASSAGGARIAFSGNAIVSVVSTAGFGNDVEAMLAQHVATVFGRSGAVTAQAGDYDASEIAVDPEGLANSAGTDVQEVLSDLDAAITAAVEGGGAVDSVFGRTGVVTASAGDYDATEITVDPAELDNSVGTDVQAVLQDLDAAITAASEGGGAVDSVFGRTGVVTATAGDYDATEITVDPEGLANSSGTDVQEVLEDFDAAITAASSGGAVESVFGRTGVVTAQAGDYQASEVSVSPAGNLTSLTVQGALEELQTEIDAIDATVVQTFTQTVGNGTETTFALAHNFGSYDVVVLVRTAAAPRTQLETSAYDVTLTDEDNLSITFASAPTAGQYEVFLATFTAGGEVGGVPLPGQQIYDAAGTYSFVVPGGVTELTAKVWGAGGGGATSGALSRVGGGGGFGQARLAVVPGEVLTVRVGAGGLAMDFTGFTGSATWPTNALPSWGGNLCGVFRGASLPSATPLVIGGSGGGAGLANTTTAANYSSGGAGGGSSGGSTGGSFGVNATGGTQIAPGAAGTNAGGTNGPLAPTAGSYLGTGTQGGRSGDFSDTNNRFGIGGGGGGGYYSGGGGGGDSSSNNTGAAGGGGGGGSGYVPSSGSLLLAPGAPTPTLTAGSGQTPAGQADVDYGLGSAGLGGAGGSNGNPGRIVLIW
jgi:hypothetical protein